MKSDDRKIGIILSAGGSAFFEAASIAKNGGLEYVVVVDRDCPAINECKRRQIPVERIDFSSKAQFSSQVREYFERQSVDGVLLLFSRLIGPELFDRLECLNVHPSLLPQFPGLAPVEQAKRANARFIGATLHQVDATVDAGPVIAQTATAISPGMEISTLNRISFLQKTLMALKAFEYFLGHRSMESSARLSPTIKIKEFSDGFSRLQEGLGADVFP